MLFHQLDRTKTVRNVKRVVHGRLPSYLLLMRMRSLTPKQVNTHRVPDDRRTRLDRSQGNAHRSVPRVHAFINARPHLEAGVPGPSVFVMRLAQVNIEINPLALWRDFKLLVALDIPKIGADENFGHVPIPQFVGLFLSIWRGLKVEFLIRADEQKVEIALCPARADLGAIPRNSLPETIFLHVHRV